jgi:hypothetical protein
MLPTPQLSATTPMTQTTLPCLDFLQAVHKQSNQFIPGHIRVDFHSHFAAMVPLQILPTRHYGTEWAAKDLSWESFVRLIEQKLGVTLQNRLLLAQVGQLQLYEIGEPGDWYEALQMCHDMGLRQCIFRLLEGDFAAEPETMPEPEPQIEQQMLERGWGRAVAAVGTAGAVTVAGTAWAAQMGFFPDCVAER